MEFPFGHNQHRNDDEDNRERPPPPPPHLHHHQFPPPPLQHPPPPNYQQPPGFDGPYPPTPYPPNTYPPPSSYFQQPGFDGPPPPYFQQPGFPSHPPHQPPTHATHFHHQPEHSSLNYSPPPPSVAHAAPESGHGMIDHHRPLKPHLPPEFHNKHTFKVYCKADPNYYLTIRDDKVVLAPSDPSDEFQHWYKDEKYSTRVKDEVGFPSFSLVNKATGQVIKHSIGASHPVQLVPYKPDLDENLVASTMVQLLCCGNGTREITRYGRLYHTDTCSMVLLIEAVSYLQSMYSFEGSLCIIFFEIFLQFTGEIIILLVWKTRPRIEELVWANKWELEEVTLMLGSSIYKCCKSHKVRCSLKV
ncbi:hypothetical protein V6N13_067676 [Hibiscus sabdariffa]